MCDVTTMSTRLKLPSYLLPSNVTFDSNSGEFYVIQSAPRSNADIVERLSRKTEASNSKLYKWQRKEPLLKRKKAVVVNHHPSFDVVSSKQAQNIVERLCRPTRASLLRGGTDSDSESGSVLSLATSGGGGNRSRSVNSRASSHTSSLRLPRASARPDRPCLVHPSARCEKSGSEPRQVRFESPGGNGGGGKWTSVSGAKGEAMPPIKSRTQSETKQITSGNTKTRESSSNGSRSDTSGNTKTRESSSNGATSGNKETRDIKTEQGIANSTTQNDSPRSISQVSESQEDTYNKVIQSTDERPVSRESDKNRHHGAESDNNERAKQEKEDGAQVADNESQVDNVSEHSDATRNEHLQHNRTIQNQNNREEAETPDIVRQETESIENAGESPTKANSDQRDAKNADSDYKEAENAESGQQRPTNAENSHRAPEGDDESLLDVAASSAENKNMELVLNYFSDY